MRVSPFHIVKIAAKTHNLVTWHGLNPFVQITLTVRGRDNSRPAHVDINISEAFCLCGQNASIRKTTMKKNKFYVPVLKKQIGQMFRISVVDNIAVTRLQSRVKLEWISFFLTSWIIWCIT